MRDDDGSLQERLAAQVWELVTDVARASIPAITAELSNNRQI